MESTVIEIQRWSTTDGPGTRTVVFLKGCPLHCSWCANPESQDRAIQLGIFPSRCVDCKACSRECPENIAIPAKEGAFSDNGCTLCGRCVDICHANARSWFGEKMSVEQIMDILKKDRVFYRNSQGGVTFSGGEPLLHPEFLMALIRQCIRLGIHSAVETCGVFNWEAAEKTIGQLDYVMFDIKHMDPQRHLELTGVSNRKTLENVVKIQNLGVPLLIRIPVIPTLNDAVDNIRATAVFVRENLPNVIGIELLPYHKLGYSKYAALGIDYTLNHVNTPDEDQMKMLRTLVMDEGVRCITPDNAYITPAAKNSKCLAV